MTADLAAAAAACHAAGITVHPVAGPGEGDRKRPYGRWGGKHHQPLALHVTQSLLSNGQHPGFGVICGRVSGHLEVVDIEGRAVPHRLDQVTAIAHDSGLGELFDRVLAGYCERTPSGGLHLLWRCPDGMSGNLKLAQAPGPPDDQGRPTVLTLVETRGEGGFCVVAPTPGYRLLAGGPNITRSSLPRSGPRCSPCSVPPTSCRRRGRNVSSRLGRRVTVPATSCDYSRPGPACRSSVIAVGV